MVDPSAGGPREPLLPRAVGRIGKDLVFSIEGPAPTLRRAGFWLQQPGGPEPGIRKLTAKEVWKASGGASRAWEWTQREGWPPERILAVPHHEPFRTSPLLQVLRDPQPTAPGASMAFPAGFDVGFEVGFARAGGHSRLVLVALWP